MMTRFGLGLVRRLEVKALWIQQLTKNKEVASLEGRRKSEYSCFGNEQIGRVQVLEAIRYGRYQEDGNLWKIQEIKVVRGVSQSTVSQAVSESWKALFAATQQQRWHKSGTSFDSQI